MKKFFIVLTGFLFFSCSESGMSRIMEIPVDIDQNLSLPLSTIAEEIKAIELELTDESLINPDRIMRVLLTEQYVIVAERTKILVFNQDGKFIHSAGNRGQGPGEYTNIRNLTIDEKNKRLYVNALTKLICYDLDGSFVNESSIAPDKPVKDLNYINGELLILVEKPGGPDSRGLFQRSVIYTLNNDLQIIDSCIIRDTYFEKLASQISPYENFILNGNETIYAYCADIYFNEQMPSEVVLRDTLYALKNNHLAPELKLKFKNNGIDGSGNKFIHLYNIYRSDQYIFAIYNNSNNNNFYHFCYDIKTGKGYNMQDGYTDDLSQIKKRIKIRPLNLNTEIFYYWYTHMNPDDFEEPNPTLYIGKLKN